MPPTGRSIQAPMLSTRLGSSAPASACSACRCLPVAPARSGRAVAGLLQSVADGLDGSAHTAAVLRPKPLRTAGQRLHPDRLICRAPTNRCVCSGTAAWPLPILWAIRLILARHHETLARDRDRCVVAEPLGPVVPPRRSVAGGGVGRVCMRLQDVARREFLEPACGARLPVGEPGLSWAIGVG